MRQSKLLLPTLREAPADAEAASHRLLLRAGYIRQLAAGIYTYLPLGLRVLHSISAIIREEMDRAGGQELLMPALQPAELWHESGRYGAYGEELLRLRDRHGREFALGPTHEEVVTAIVRSEVSSYRKLPMLVYQIQTKIRDERRPRFGLLRGREFLMKDAYSFDTDREGLDLAYQRMHEAYNRIFTRIGLDFRAVHADAGAIGGDGGSHEFLALADIGEDALAACTQCGYAANVETEPGERCRACGGAYELQRGIELGHIFKLGTKYSEAMGAVFLDASGQARPMIMGCYGIGVSRVMAAVAEQYRDEAGLAWPASVAPYLVHLLPVSARDERQRTVAERLYAELTAAGIGTLLDDRDERPGVKFADADLIGVPIRIVVGRGIAEGIAEFRLRTDAGSRPVAVSDVLQTVREAVRHFDSGSN